MYEIKLSIFAIFSILMASQVNRAVFFSDTGKRIIAFWVLVLPFVFIIRNELLNMVMFIVTLALLNRSSPSPIFSVLLFIGVLGAVPDWSNYVVSVPGINYLIGLTFVKVAVIVLLIPLLFRPGFIARVPWNVTDTLVFSFVFLMIILTFRDGKLTTVLRFFADSTLTFLIPYFVFTRVVRTVNDLHYYSLGILMLSVLVGALFIVSQAVKIDIYTELNPYSNFHFHREARLGFLRLSGPFNGVLVGFLMLSGYFAFELLKKYRFIRSAPSWIVLGVCLLCVLFGGSRGALFGFIMGLFLYFYFVKLSGTKRTLVAAVLVVMIVLELMFNISSIVKYEDEYGTFDYRAELYDASWEFLKRNMLWGAPNYLDSGYFNHLVTGLGIIDIVSAYLQVALQYGIITLLLFIGMFLSVIIPLGKKVISIKNMNESIAQYAAVYFILNVVMLFIISTTSMISLFPTFIMMNLAIGRVLANSELLKRIT